MHLLMLVSDFAEVVHVQRPEDGTAQHVRLESPGHVLLDEQPMLRSRLARLMRTVRLRHSLKRAAS